MSIRRYEDRPADDERCGCGHHLTGECPDAEPWEDEELDPLCLRCGHASRPGELCEACEIEVEQIKHQIRELQRLRASPFEVAREVIGW